MKTGVMDIDGSRLWQMLESEGLLDVSPRTMDADQISTLACIFNECVHGATPAYWLDPHRSGQRVLCIPWTAPRRDKIFLVHSPDDRQALWDVLKRLGASEEDLKHYGLDEASRKVRPVKE